MLASQYAVGTGFLRAKETRRSCVRQGMNTKPPRNPIQTVMRWLGNGLLACGLGAAALTALALQRGVGGYAYAGKATGRVIAVSEERSPAARTPRVLQRATIGFEVDGRAYRFEDPVLRGGSARGAVGDAVSVRFDPADPNHASVPSLGFGVVAGALGMVAALTLCGMGAGLRLLARLPWQAR